MFDSSVEKFGDLAVHDEDGEQSNGIVMGSEDALFLAKFLATLIINYETMVTDMGMDPEGPLDQTAYSEAITQTLKDFVAEDSRKHGRLLAMRTILSSLTEKKRLQREQLACMYSRDLIIARNQDVNDEEAIQSVIEEPPNEEEVEQVINRRESEQRFASEQMF